jgi:hypothetical protein
MVIAHYICGDTKWIFAAASDVHSAGWCQPETPAVIFGFLFSCTKSSQVATFETKVIWRETFGVPLFI